jgi:hypothetical protein
MHPYVDTLKKNVVANRGAWKGSVLGARLWMSNFASSRTPPPELIHLNRGVRLEKDLSWVCIFKYTVY